jgi:hypothetical protein
VKRWPAIGVLLVLGVGCSGENDPAITVQTTSGEVTTSTTEEASTTSEATTTTTLPAAEAVRDYFELVEASDGGLGAVDRAAPGSPAAAYAQVQAAEATAFIQAGTPRVPFDVTVEDDGSIRSCPEQGGTSADCVVFDDFVVTPDGLLSEFTVQGRSIAGRVVGATGASAQGRGATATLLGAFEYNTQAGLGVLLEIRAGDAVVLPPSPSSASYVSADGAQFQGGFDSIGGFNDVQPGAAVTVMLSFGGGVIGGSVTFDLCSEDFSCDTVSMPVG